MSISDLIKHPDSRVNAMYRSLAGKSSRAAPLLATVPSRADRAAKPASNNGEHNGTGSGKAAWPGSSYSGRFEHFAGVTDLAPLPRPVTEPAPAARVLSSVQRPLSRAEMIRAQIEHEGYDTVEDAMVAVVGRPVSGAKPSGSSVYPPPSRQELADRLRTQAGERRAEPDFSTPESAAAFVLSAGILK